jgi:signal transduction histidine kinase
MWQLRRVLAASRSESYADELFESSSRSFIAMIALLLLSWHFFAAATWPSTIGRAMWLPTVCFLPLAATAYFLVSRHFFAAQFVWLSCLLVTISTALVVFQLPEIAVFFALLPLVAILAIGWPAAVVVELMLALLMIWLVREGAVANFPIAMGVAVLVSGILLGIVGWITIRTLFTTLQWALSSWAEAQRNAQSAREHRAGLLELNIQLDRTNHQLDKANAALLAAWRVADEAERFKAEFVTNVSHEMRTPLNLIIGFSHMMVTSPESYGGKPLPSGYRGDLYTVYRSAQHLLALVDDIIDLARIDAGKIPLVRYEIDLGVLVQETTEIVRKYIAAKEAWT